MTDEILGTPWPHAHPELLMAKELIFDPLHLSPTLPIAEPESAEYGAFSLTINNMAARFRVAKTTPTKVGLFVTLWQRSDSGPIRPFDSSDGVDLAVVSTRQGERFGQFVFPLATLLQRGVVSQQGIGGKRAIRVYPPWVVPNNAQAKSTQTWQVRHFLRLDAAVDLQRATQLYRHETKDG